jgi:2,4-dienoyl-CoA reductase (NADPH2)
MTIEEIHQFTEFTGEGARRAREAGFDGVEFLSGAGCLLQRFLSPFANVRQDEYGGSFENRMRFPLEIIASIRKKAGEDYTLSYRYSADEFLKGGYDLEGGKQIGSALEKAGVDCLNLQVGWHESPIPMVQREAPLGCWVYLSAGVKEVVNIPVISTYRLSGDPFVAERALAEGKTDLIGMARGFIADPDFPNKAREGRLDEIRHCIVCCRCLDRALSEDSHTVAQPIELCSVNARMGEDLETTIEPAPRPKKILIAGGGPAGMEAARVAALRGHKITLCEKGQRLGGSQIIGAILTRENDNLIRYLARQMQKLGVKVKLNTEVTPSLVDEMKPDAVVLATGGIHINPQVPTSEERLVSFDDIEVLTDRHLPARGGVGRRILWRLASMVVGYFYKPSLIRWGMKFGFPFKKRTAIIGGGFDSCELAEFLARSGKEVTIISESKRIGNDIGATTKYIAMQNLSKLGVKMETNAKLTRITNKGVEASRADSMEFFEADSIVPTLGAKPNKELAEQLEGKGIPVYLIGDCADPERIGEAVKAGYRLGIML